MSDWKVLFVQNFSNVQIVRHIILNLTLAYLPGPLLFIAKLEEVKPANRRR